MNILTNIYSIGTFIAVVCFVIAAFIWIGAVANWLVADEHRSEKLAKWAMIFAFSGVGVFLLGGAVCIVVETTKDFIASLN